MLAVAVLGLIAAGAMAFLRSPSPEQESRSLVVSNDLRDLASAVDDAPTGDDVAPDFSVPTLHGEGFTLSRHLAEDGRPVILNLWASWCFPCREEMPTLDAFQKAHPEVAVVGVAVQDDIVAAERFATEIGVEYTIGFDEKDVVNVEYSPLGLPATFWISSDGAVAKRLFGTLTAESLETDLAVFSG